MSEGLPKVIAWSTHTRVDMKLQRVYVDLSGKMTAKSIGGKRCTLIVRGDCTRFIRLYLLGKKSNAASAFESLLAKVWADGTPYAVMAVRSDDGGESFGGEFGVLRR